MSQKGFDDLDAEFAELLGEDAAEDTNMGDAQLPAAEPTLAADQPSKPTQPAVPLDDATAGEAAASQAHHVTADDDRDDGVAVNSTAAAQAQASKPPAGAAAVSGGASKKPALAGRKRQLTVPSSAPAAASAATKQDVTKVKAAIITAPPEPTTITEKETTATDSAATAAASTTSPTKRPRTEPATAPALNAEGSAAADDTMVAVDAEEIQAVEDDDMQDAGEEEEVKSPIKTAKDPIPEQAAAAPKQQAKPVVGKKKSLVVAKAADPQPSESAADKATASASVKTSKPPAAKRAKKAASDAPSSSAAPTVKLPKPKNAFMIFADEKRATIKEANPGFGVADVAKQLGELWKAMAVEDKQQYVDKAIADKERCAAEIAAMDQDVVAAIRKAEVDKRAAKGGKKGAIAAAAATEAPAAGAAADEQPSVSEKPTIKDSKEAKKEAKREAKAASKEKDKEKDAAAAAKKAEKAAAKAAAKEAANKKKAAFKCFYTSKYRSFREKSPDASPEDISTQIKEAWEALSEEDQQPFYARAEEEAEALRAASKSKAQASNSGAASGSRRGRGRRTKAAADKDAEEGSDDEEEGARGDTGDDDDSDREDVDWDEHPAAAIIAHTTDGSSLLVQRKGVGLNEYGIVNARKLKQQVMGSGDDSEKLPVTTAMFENYEGFKKSFWTAVHKRTCRGAIDMEDLEEGSPLEMCYLLGKLQEENQLCCPKGKPARNKGSKEEDFLITVPGLKLSMAMQRIVNVARSEKAQVQQHLGQLLQALEAEEGLSDAAKEAVALASAALKV